MKWIGLGLLLLSTTLPAQEITIINNYADTSGVGKDQMQLSDSRTHTLVINYYEPAPISKVNRLQELIGQSLEFYLDEVISVDSEELGFKKSSNQVIKDLNNIVKDAIRYYNFKEVNDFEGFSKEVEDLVKEIDGLNWRKSKLFVRNADEKTKKELLYAFAQQELFKLKLKANMEVGNFSNDNLLSLSETAVRGLSPEEQSALLQELNNFQKNDALEPIEVDFSSATITLLAAEDEFVLPQAQASDRGPQKESFEERILKLLEENNRRMDQIEADIAELKGRPAENRIPSMRNDNSDLQVQIDELRYMLAEFLQGANSKRDPINRPISEPKATVYNIPEKVIFNFNKGKYSLDLASRLMLNEIIDILFHQPNMNILVTGFADRTGDARLNLELSRKRAQAVRTYLIDQGINPNRIVMNYYGDRNSFGANPNDRKVEVEFLRF
jgi:outer membrane protein OmpA-like peptidoglycan-associated protein